MGQVGIFWCVNGLPERLVPVEPLNASREAGHTNRHPWETFGSTRITELQLDLASFDDDWKHPPQWSHSLCSTTSHLKGQASALKKNVKATDGIKQSTQKANTCAEGGALPSMGNGFVATTVPNKRGSGRITHRGEICNVKVTNSSDGNGRLSKDQLPNNAFLFLHISKAPTHKSYSRRNADSESREDFCRGDQTKKALWIFQIC